MSVAIVTGSSKGIGAAIAENLANEGFSVVVNYSSDAAPAEELVAKILKNNGQAIALKADVSDPLSFKQLFDMAESKFGKVNVLVNNAGIMKLAPLSKTDDQLFDQTLAINLKGTFNGMREAANRLTNGGRIINFSSSVVGLYQPTYAAYAASKAGVEAMTHILAKELGSRQITVNAVAPGPTATELFLKGKPQEVVDSIVEKIPLNRLGEVSDIARVVSFLASEESGWINGQIIRVNGGAI